MGESVDVRLRPFSWDDLPIVVEIINRSDEIDGLERGISEEELRAWWTSPGMEPESNAFLATVDGEVVGHGFVHLRKGDERSGFSKFQVYGIVLPEWRGKGVGTRIFAECERRARRRLDQAPTPTVYLEAHADKRQHDVAELYAKFGLEPARYFFEMIYDSPEMPAAPDYPPGYGVRTFVRGQDEEVVWRVMNIAFRDHWGHVDRPLEDWLHRVDSDYFSPDLTYLGLAPNGQVVGECLCRIYPEENERLGREQGWVSSLGVLREHRRKGLGRALLLEGMRGLRRRGCTHIALGVDSKNPTGALGLYESVGFREWRTGVAYRKTLRE